jgi:hypothetical protein
MEVRQDTWQRLRTAFYVMAAGFGAAAAGLAGDFYQHEVVGFSADLESMFAPVHLLIFGGIALFGLGLLLGLRQLRIASRVAAV